MRRHVHARRSGAAASEQAWLASSLSRYSATRRRTFCAQLRLCNSTTPKAPIWRKQVSDGAAADEVKVASQEMQGPPAGVVKGRTRPRPASGDVVPALRELSNGAGPVLHCDDETRRTPASRHSEACIAPRALFEDSCGTNRPKPRRVTFAQSMGQGYFAKAQTQRLSVATTFEKYEDLQR